MSLKRDFNIRGSVPFPVKFLCKDLNTLIQDLYIKSGELLRKGYHNIRIVDNSRGWGPDFSFEYTRAETNREYKKRLNKELKGVKNILSHAVKTKKDFPEKAGKTVDGTIEENEKKLGIIEHILRGL